MTVIGSGFPERTDPAALVIGPTGVALSPNCADSDPGDCVTKFGESGDPVLYVADTLNNRIAVITDALNRNHSAGTGETLTIGGSLIAPLALTVAEGGHLLTVNSGDGFITEITQQGPQIAKTQLDKSGTPPGAGALFGLIYEQGRGVVFVDDATNTLNLLQ
jgi:DNA-binding beta-propeller fold protein YncE